MRTLIKTSLVSFFLLAPALAFADDPPRDDMGQTKDDMNDTSKPDMSDTSKPAKSDTKDTSKQAKKDAKAEQDRAARRRSNRRRAASRSPRTKRS